MSTPRILISHSSGTETALLDAVCAELEHDYTLLVDKRLIEVGDVWREKIHAFLAECDAALILFSKRALDQPFWVLKEATILVWRQLLDPTFRLIPVRLPGVEAKDFDASPFAPLKLRDIEQLKSGDAAEIARVTRSRVEGLTRLETPLDRIQGAIADALEQVGPRTLETGAHDCFGQIEWTRAPSRHARFAELLARRIMKDGPKCLTTAIEVLSSLRPGLRADIAKRIVEAVQPLWVEGDAAGRIPSIADRTEGWRDVAINGKWLTFTAPSYLRRAFPYGRLFHLAPVDGAPDEGYVAYVVLKIREWCRQEVNPVGWSDDDVDRYLNQTLGRELFVLLPAMPDASALEGLRLRYPNATFLLGSGAKLPDESRLPAGVRRIEPELDLRVEDGAQQAHYHALQFVKGLG